MARVVLILFVFYTCYSQAQLPLQWPGGKKTAIILTYDDALLSQLNIAIPQLDSFHYKGTFFLSGNLTEDDMLRWRTASMNGHELGNHTLYHPCAKETLKGKPRYITENYTVEDMLREIAMMNKLIFAIDNKKQRSYAYPCSETLAGGKDYVDSLRQSHLISYARTGGDNNAVITDFRNLDFFRIPSWGFANNPGDKELIDFVKKVADKNAMGVLMFHGVGGDYLNVSADAHRKLLQYLRNQDREIWVATFSEVLDYIAKTTGRK